MQEWILLGAEIQLIWVLCDPPSIKRCWSGNSAIRQRWYALDQASEAETSAGGFRFQYTCVCCVVTSSLHIPVTPWGQLAEEDQMAEGPLAIYGKWLMAQSNRNLEGLGLEGWWQGIL
jgi:hypothetical protein